MSTDCLVLNISDDSIKLFIIYDPLNDKFCIWGKTFVPDDSLSDNDNDNENEFVYKCNSNHKKQINTFVKFILDDEVNLTLYSVSNLPDKCSEITHDLFDENCTFCDKNVVAHYNNTSLRKKYLFRLLTMLKFIQNE